MKTTVWNNFSIYLIVNVVYIELNVSFGIPKITELNYTQQVQKYTDFPFSNHQMCVYA